MQVFLKLRQREREHRMRRLRRKIRDIESTMNHLHPDYDAQTISVLAIRRSEAIEELTSLERNPL